MTHHAPRSLALLTLGAALAACSDDATDGPPTVTTGSYVALAQRGWTMPTSSALASAAAFDLDDDDRRANQVGSLIATLAAVGLEVDDANAAMLETGDPILAHVLRGDAWDDDPSVAWQLWRSSGEPLRFDGTDRIGASAVDGALWGAITERTLAARWGDVVIPVPLFRGQPPIMIPLVDARLELAVEAPFHGRIGGAIDGPSLTVALDEVGRQTIAHLQAHPEHPFSTAAVEIMDANNDGVLTAAEVVLTARSLLVLDVDRDGDGLNDSVSFALAFDATTALLATTPTF